MLYLGHSLDQRVLLENLITVVFKGDQSNSWSSTSTKLFSSCRSSSTTCKKSDPSWRDHLFIALCMT
ncbi:hypothetical protein E2C01_024411 [Portunus trituberculatus]|uniref:Uncharacterized protein n=1 Tax=Portunus trituberculatus TaxID=210409 RepID=A0A5B7EAI0_PORTR|nr:hypothetical protein [Portunus trituberculatus]